MKESKFSYLKFGMGIGELGFGTYMLYSKEFADKIAGYVYNYLPNEIGNYKNYIVLGLAITSIGFGLSTIAKS